MNVTILIRPGVDPFCRGDIEDYLLDHVEGFDLHGGGTSLGEVSESDMDGELPDDRSPDEWAKDLRTHIESIPVTEDTAWMNELELEFEIRIDGEQKQVWKRPRSS